MTKKTLEILPMQLHHQSPLNKEHLLHCPRVSPRCPIASTQTSTKDLGGSHPTGPEGGIKAGVRMSTVTLLLIQPPSLPWSIPSPTWSLPHSFPSLPLSAHSNSLPPTHPHEDLVVLGVIARLLGTGPKPPISCGCSPAVRNGVSFFFFLQQLWKTCYVEMLVLEVQSPSRIGT